MRARVLRLAGWALACLLLAGCLSAADRLALAWPAIGVRMSAPVNADACEKAAELAAESGARVSFWAEEAALLSTPRAEAEATAVRFWGDGSLAWRLADFNQIKNANLIYPGQVLRIPAKSSLPG